MGIISFFFFSVKVAFLYVNINNATLRAAHGATVRLNCTTNSSKHQRHALVNEWRKDGVKLPDESGSSLTISYINASDIIDKYHCVYLSYYFSLLFFQFKLHSSM